MRFRVDGDCSVYQDIPPAYRNPLVARFKIMAQLDVTERRKPQDGKIRFKYSRGTIELRVATIPTANQNEDVVMRILAASKPLPIDRMGFSENNLARFKQIRMSARDLDGNAIEEAGEGFVARVWQHEFDHLNGTLLTDRMGAVAKMGARRTLKELEEKYRAEHPTK